MKRLTKYATLMLVLLSTTHVSAQDDTAATGWQRSLIWDITTTQTAYSDSWAGGEVGSVNWVTNLNGSAERQLSPKMNYKTTLKVSFGQTMTQEITQDTAQVTTKSWSKPQKSTDLIDWENVARFTLGKIVDPYAAFRLETQFFDGKDSRKKLFFSPLKLTESAGIAREFYKKEEDFLTSRFGLGIRQIFVSSIIDLALNTETETLTDGGFESVTDAAFSFHENLRYTGKLTLFKAIFSSESDAVEGTPAEDYWKAIDVNWENIVSASITKIVTVNLYTQVLYDKEVSLKGRFKETVAIGFVFKMI